MYVCTYVRIYIRAFSYFPRRRQVKDEMVKFRNLKAPDKVNIAEH